MPTLIFRGAFLRDYDFRFEESGWFVRMKLTADWTDVVRERMSWDEPGEKTLSSKLEGALVAQHVILTPNAKELKKHELQIDCNDVSDFQFFRVKDGESYKRELRFSARTAVDGAEGILGAYARRMGQSASQLRVTYNKQEDLPFSGEEPEEPAE